MVRSAPRHGPSTGCRGCCCRGRCALARRRLQALPAGRVFGLAKDRRHFHVVVTGKKPAQLLSYSCADYGNCFEFDVWLSQFNPFPTKYGEEQVPLIFRDNRSRVKNKILGLTRLNLLAVSADLDGLALVPGVVEMLYLVKAELFAANPVDFENTAQRSGAEAGRKDPRDLRTVTSRLRGKASKSTELACVCV